MADRDVGSTRLTTEDGATVEFTPTRLVVAGYTGSDRAAVDHHIRELAEAGIAPPDRVPSYFELPASLAFQGTTMTVQGAHTSGEVEPVLVFTDTEPLLTVGSDHTDRDVEKVDVLESKAACPKIFARDALRYLTVASDWNECILQSWAADGRYQEGSLGLITPPEKLLEDFEAVMGRPEVGLVLYLGTIPLVRDTFVFASSYRMSLTTPSAHSIEFTYRVLRRT